MEDNAPVHKKVCIPAREALRMETLEWPPNSPDLNPIENISPSWLWRLRFRPEYIIPFIRKSGGRMSACWGTRVGYFGPCPILQAKPCGRFRPVIQSSGV